MASLAVPCSVEINDSASSWSVGEVIRYILYSRHSKYDSAYIWFRGVARIMENYRHKLFRRADWDRSMGSMVQKSPGSSRVIQQKE